LAIAYIDSSALLKLLVREAETSALEADLASREGLITSSLAVVECRRAVRRSGHRRVLQRAEQVFEAVYLLDLSPAIIEGAATVDPATIRSLDAIHLATALSVGDENLDLITYDDRMAEAARRHGLRVIKPGR